MDPWFNFIRAKPLSYCSNLIQTVQSSIFLKKLPGGFLRPAALTVSALCTCLHTDPAVRKYRTAQCLEFELSTCTTDICPLSPNRCCFQQVTSHSRCVHLFNNLDSHIVLNYSFWLWPGHCEANERTHMDRSDCCCHDVVYRDIFQF